MNIIVTGSEGNIGSRLVPYLRLCGHRVQRVDIVQRYAPDYTLCDITRPGELSRLAATGEPPDAIIHMAAMVSRVTCEASPEMCVDTNLTGTNNVIQIAKFHGAKLIYFSTSEVYGNIGGTLFETRTDLAPNNRYGLTKLMGEMLVKYERKTHGLDAVILRPFMFYDENETFGDNRSAMIRFAEALLTGERITVHSGAWRSWMHMTDAVQVIEAALRLDCPPVLNIGHPEEWSMDRLARLMCELTGRAFDEVTDITPLPGRMTLGKSPGLSMQTALMGRNWKPISIESGVEKVIETVKKRLMDK